MDCTRKNENLKKDLAHQGIDKTPCAPYSDVGSVRPKLSPEEQTIVDALSESENMNQISDLSIRTNQGRDRDLVQTDLVITYFEVAS